MFIAMFVLLVTVVLFSVTASADTYPAFGDVDQNGKINVNDALDVLKYSVGKIRRFSADTGYNGVIHVPERYDFMYMQVGCTRAAACYFECYEGEYTVQVDNKNPLLTKARGFGL